MPAQLVPGEFCSSYFATYEVRSQSNALTVYTVSLWGSEAPALCTCPAYQYSGERRECKHIDYVFKHACMWNCQWHTGNKPVELEPKSINTGSVIPDSHCPNCNAPLVAVMIAV